MLMPKLQQSYISQRFSCHSISSLLPFSSLSDYNFILFSMHLTCRVKGKEFYFLIMLVSFLFSYLVLLHGNLISLHWILVVVLLCS